MKTLHLLNKLSSLSISTFILILSLSGMVKAQDSTATDYFNRGKILYNNADYEKAEGYFTQAINLEPTNINALLQRGFTRNLLKNFEGAITDFSEVIKLNPEHQWAYISRGSALNKTGEYNSAIADFDKALEMDPDDQEAYNNRGFSKKMLGDKKGACEDWNKSKKLGNNEAKIILKNNHCK